MEQKRAQNAIEFLAMLCILLLIFIALFGFVLTQYGRVLTQRDTITLIKVLNDVRSEVRQALFAPDGYTRQFYIQDTSISSYYNLSIRNTGELYINDSRGFSQILFLKPDEYLSGNICAKQNEIIKSVDYGIGVCCNSCNGSVPGVNYSLLLECKLNTSIYWMDCNDLSQQDNLTRLRTRCSPSMTGANITMYNQTGNQLLFANLVTNNVTMRSPTVIWTSAIIPAVRLTGAIYNVTATCYNSTFSYQLKSNFTIV